MNDVFHSDPTYYLSYMALPSELTLKFDKAFFGDTNPNLGRDETAICIREPWKCLILYGDHREALKPIAGDLEACKKYWEAHPELHGFTTDTL